MLYERSVLCPYDGFDTVKFVVEIRARITIQPRFRFDLQAILLLSDNEK